MSIDLHIHSTASDGDIDPVSIVRMAAGAGLKIIALADHESTDGYHPARQESIAYGLIVVPAVEIMSFYKDKEVHVLGYFPDPDKTRLQNQLAELRHQRTLCAKASVEKLQEYGFQISWRDVEKLAQPGGPVSKGHLMQALNKAGYIKERGDALDILVKYLNVEGLAYICHPFSFDDAVALIRDADGIPVLAHPGLIRDDEIVAELCAKDIDGLEVFYYYFGQHREERVQKYSALADDKSLLKTGGSDYHGTYTPVVLGENSVPLEGVKDFLKLFGLF